MAKKRGASMSTCGHSNDHYQDILRQDPAHILLILQLCNLIAIGTLTDGPARTLLLNGKGTALVKNITDVRPIVTVHPLLHYTGHAIATEYSTRIRTITRKVSHKKVCGFCNFVHILWKVTKLHRKLASDVTCHKKFFCVKSQGKYICGCHKILSLC